jgi:hypothetical protein
LTTHQDWLIPGIKPVIRISNTKVTGELSNGTGITGDILATWKPISRLTVPLGQKFKIGVACSQLLSLKLHYMMVVGEFPLRHIIK